MGTLSMGKFSSDKVKNNMLGGSGSNFIVEMGSTLRKSLTARGMYN